MNERSLDHSVKASIDEIAAMINAARPQELIAEISKALDSGLALAKAEWQLTTRGLLLLGLCAGLALVALLSLWLSLMAAVGLTVYLLTQSPIWALATVIVVHFVLLGGLLQYTKSIRRELFFARLRAQWASRSVPTV